MFNRVVASADSVFDTLRRAAVAGHFHAMVVGGANDGLHFFEGHAQRVLVVPFMGGGVAGRIGLYPFHAVLNQRRRTAARGFVGTVDEQRARPSMPTLR